MKVRKKILYVFLSLTLFIAGYVFAQGTTPYTPPWNYTGINSSTATVLNAIQPYKKIVTNVTQSSTTAPVDTTTEDNQSTAHTWTRYSAGYYALFCNDCFDLYGSDATQVFISNTTDTAFVSARVVHVDSIVVRTFNATKILIDGALTRNPMEIRMPL